MPHIPPIQEHTSIIILSAIAEHDTQLGVSSVALVLKGSKSKRIENRKLYHSKFFGALFYYPVDVIENFCRQLAEKNMIHAVMAAGFPYPVPFLELTENGKYLLENKVDMPLEVRRTVKPIKLNESIQETFSQFQKLKNITMVAGQRNLAASTIWGHLEMCIKLGLLAAVEVVDEEKVRLILEIKNNLQPRGLKELKQALPQNISYEEIRCVLAQEME